MKRSSSIAALLITGLSLFVLALFVLALVAGPSHAARRYKVTIDSVPQQAAVYLEAKDAGVQGYTPHVFNLKAGTYTIILEKAGHEPLSRNIVVKKKAATHSFTLVAKPTQSKLTLEAAAGAEIAGATVKVNGKEVGVLPLAVTLQPGRYLVEVEKAGFSSFSKWIDVKRSEQRTIVVNLVSTAPTKGNLLIAANIIGAEVFVDGRKVDTAPAFVEALAPGPHTVAVKAAGYTAKGVEAKVVAGKTIKVSIELTPDQATVAKNSGTLQVLSSHKNVEVIVDSTPRGKAPLKVTGLAEGSHVVEGRKEGMVTAEATISIKKGELKTIKLTLEETPPVRRHGSVRVVSPTLGAMVFVDGRYVGKTPHTQHKLDPGPHFVSVRKKGFKEQVSTVEIKAGQIAKVEAPLKKLEGADDPTKLVKKAEPPPDDPDRVRGVASHHAVLVPPSLFAADLSLGFPYLFEGRLTTGFFSGKLLAMDGGLAMRTFGAVSEIGIHTRLRLYRNEMFATALFFGLGGGGGPKARNTFYSEFGGVGSLNLKNRVYLSGRVFFNVYTDRVCPDKPDPNELTACSTPPSSTGLTSADARNRQGGVRLFLSAIAEVVLTRHINLFAVFEGVPFQGDRQLYTDPFAELMAVSDPGTYFRLGVSIKR